MGFFDPAYKKTLAITPASFQRLADAFMPKLDDMALVRRIPNPDIWKAATMGLVALHVSERQSQDWPLGVVAYVADHTKIALKCMREDEREDAGSSADWIIGQLPF